MAVHREQCPRCESEAKLRLREFSDQAVAALIAWGELEKKLLNKAICDECYGELRDTLIDRSEEFTDKSGKSSGVKKAV